MQPIVVFDTNVLLSAIGWKGSPYHCIDLARQGRVKGNTLGLRIIVGWVYRV